MSKTPEEMKEVYKALEAEVDDLRLGLRKYIIFDSNNKPLDVVKGAKNALDRKKLLIEEGASPPLRIETF